MWKIRLWQSTDAQCCVEPTCVLSWQAVQMRSVWAESGVVRVWVCVLRFVVGGKQVYVS